MARTVNKNTEVIEEFSAFNKRLISKISGLTVGNGDFEATVFYNKAADQDVPSDWSEARFYEGLALRELRQAEKANAIFDDLIATAEKSLSEEGVVDFFAKFGEQESAQTQRAENHYELGLGLLGQGEIEKAKVQFEQALTFNVGHTWARYQLSGF